MAMKSSVHDKLKKLLEGEKDLLETIVGWQDAAEAKEKVQTANEEISKERDELKELSTNQKNDLEKATKSLTEKDDEIKRLQDGQLTDEDRKKIELMNNKGMSPDAEAKFNKLTEVVETLQTSLNAEKEERTKDKEIIAQTKQNEASALLRSDLTNALSEAKIVGDSAEMALSFITSKGLAKINKPENGEGFTRSIIIQKDGKPFEATPKELAEHIAATHENLVSSSGNTGSGADHSSDNTGHNTTKATEGLRETRAQADDMWDKHPK